MLKVYKFEDYKLVNFIFIAYLCGWKNNLNKYEKKYSIFSHPLLGFLAGGDGQLFVGGCT